MNLDLHLGYCFCLAWDLSGAFVVGQGCVGSGSSDLTTLLNMVGQVNFDFGVICAVGLVGLLHGVES